MLSGSVTNEAGGRESSMTESDWWAGQGPQRMLSFLWCNGKLSERKARLFAVAACRRAWHLLPNDRGRKAIEVAERYADAEATRKELAAAQSAIRGVNCVTGRSAGQAAAAAARYAAGAQRHYSTLHAVRAASIAARLGCQGGPAAQNAATSTEDQAQACLLRDVFGPLPFRRVVLDGAVLTWNAGTVVKLARSAYDERLLPTGHLDPARLAVLADALEEAGCTDGEILSHLRGPGPHVRGCWPLDLIVGEK